MNGFRDTLRAGSQATIVTLYMSPEFNAKLRPVLLQHLRPGARVVSHDLGMEE